MRRIILVLAAVGLVAGGALAFGNHGRTAERAFLTAAVERGRVATTITATGTIKAVVTVDVGSQLSGQIDALYVDFNDNVSKGQPLARIDQGSYIAKVREVEASREAARSGVLVEEANIQRVRGLLAVENAKVTVLEARTQRARATLAAAELDFDRIGKLKASGATTERQLEQARTARNVAAAQAQEAEAESVVHAEAIAVAEADLRRAEAELRQARTSVLQRESLLERALIELNQTVIRSPIDGVVIDRNIDRGQTVAASLEAPTSFKIAQDLRDMEVHARIDEGDIGLIRVGQAATFRVDAFPDRPFTGRVRQIRGAPVIVNNVVTYTVVVGVQNPDLLLLPGMTALVRISISEANGVLKLPNAALRFRLEEGLAAEAPSAEIQTPGTEELAGVVWVHENAWEARPVRVRLGLSDDSMTEIKQGTLEEGQEVIVGLAPGKDDRRMFGIRLGF